MAERYDYNIESERLDFIASANERGLRIAEVPWKHFFHILEPWEEWDGSKVVDNTEAYTAALKTRKLAELDAFMAGVVEAEIEEKYGVDLDFSAPLTVSRMMSLVMNSGMTINEIFAITRQCYEQVAEVYEILKGQFVALSTIAEIDGYDIEEHYRELVGESSAARDSESG